MKRLVLCLSLLLLFIVPVLAPQPLRAARNAAPPAGFVRDDLGAGLSAPTAIAFDNDTYYVTEKGGSIRVVDSDGTLHPDAWKTLSVNTDSERGLLGIALATDFSSSKTMYIYYTTGSEAKNYSGSPENRVSRLRKRTKGNIKEKILLDHIPSTNGNHNGGDIHIGFDGKLWISVGESGCCASDAQGLDTLRGKILRINTDGSIPTDNPYYNKPGARQETWAHGFRNPWRFAMRQSNQTYIVADVGSGTWEEIDNLKRKKNYGWPIYEGPCPSSNLACDPATADLGKTQKPIHWYNHNGVEETGNVIAGGAFAENGSNYPAPYNGAYFYGDTGGGWVHVLTLDSNNVETSFYEFDDVTAPVAFGNGPDGNIYVVDYGAGLIRRYRYTGG